MQLMPFHIEVPSWIAHMRFPGGPRRACSCYFAVRGVALPPPHPTAQELRAEAVQITGHAASHAATIFHNHKALPKCAQHAVNQPPKTPCKP